MRIIAGTHRGRPFVTPPGDRVRPTTDRVREALFNVLAHCEYVEHLATLPEDARVLDMFAGAGSLGLEALSRGAKWVVFVDDHPESRGVIRQNVETLEATGTSKIIRRDATALGALDKNIRGPFDLVFLDPPYGLDLAVPALTSAREGGWLADGALCIVEQARAEPPLEMADFEELETREYGAVRLTFLRPLPADHE